MAGLSSAAACAPAGGSVGAPLWVGSGHWQRTTGTAAEGESELRVGYWEECACHCPMKRRRKGAAWSWRGGGGVVGRDRAWLEQALALEGYGTQEHTQTEKNMLVARYEPTDYKLY